MHCTERDTSISIIFASTFPICKSNNYDFLNFDWLISYFNNPNFETVFLFTSKVINFHQRSLILHLACYSEVTIFPFHDYVADVKLQTHTLKKISKSSTNIFKPVIEHWIFISKLFHSPINLPYFQFSNFLSNFPFQPKNESTFIDFHFQNESYFSLPALQLYFLA